MLVKSIKTRQGGLIRRAVATVVTVLIIGCAAEAKPDLIVSKITMTRGRGGIFVEKVAVTVTNGCSENSGASHLQLTFKDDAQPNSRQIYYVVSAIRALRGGERQTLTFNIFEKKIVFGRHILAEADAYRKIDEASEDNNSRTVFPDGTKSTLRESRCASEGNKK